VLASKVQQTTSSNPPKMAAIIASRHKRARNNPSVVTKNQKRKDRVRHSRRPRPTTRCLHRVRWHGAELVVCFLPKAREVQLKKAHVETIFKKYTPRPFTLVEVPIQYLACYLRQLVSVPLGATRSGFLRPGTMREPRAGREKLADEVGGSVVSADRGRGAGTT
jgi:hypothetical protein